MWSWWDCMHSWGSAWSGTTWDAPWLMFVPMLWPVLVIGAIILVVMLLLRDGRTQAGRRDTGLMPFEILRERFARGEIDEAEYEERQRVISQS